MQEGNKSCFDKMGSKLSSLYWYLLQKKAMAFHAVFVSRPVQAIRRFTGRLRKPVEISALRIAIIAHVYYPDLMGEIFACREVLGGDVPIHLTVPEERLTEVNELMGERKNIIVYPVKNRGRDIAPFLHVLQSGDFENYDAVLKLHTKRSPHLGYGNIQRKAHFLSLCGERHSTYQILSHFKNPSTGMIGMKSAFRTAPFFMMDNAEIVVAIAKRMGISGPVRFGFFEGSMFWFRPSAFNALRELNMTADEFEPEKGQLDGTLQHALERCFALGVWEGNKIVCDLKGHKLEGKI
jgi:lipopolysaccharide biosynthesis protein